MRKRSKKKLNKLDKYLIFSIGFVVIYTIAHSIIFAVTGLEAKVLDVLVYGFFAGEITSCLLIKRFNIKEEAKLVLNNKKENDTDVVCDEDLGDFE